MTAREVDSGAPGKDLTDSDLTGVEMQGSSLWRANLSNSILINCPLHDIEFGGCDFTSADLTNADFDLMKLKKAVSLQGVNFGSGRQWQVSASVSCCTASSAAWADVSALLPPQLPLLCNFVSCVG